MAKGDAILLSDLPPEVTGARSTSSTDSLSAGTGVPGAGLAAPAAGDVPALARALFQLARKDTRLKVIPWVERELIVQSLQETGGNQVQAARLLGITRATLRKRIEKFGIKQELAIK